MKNNVFFILMITCCAQTTIGMRKSVIPQDDTLKDIVALLNAIKQPASNITVNVQTDVKGTTKSDTSQAVLETEKPVEEKKIETPETPLPSLYESTLTHTTSFLSNHWGKCVAGSVVGLYVTLYTVLQMGKNVVTQSHTWSSWKEHIDLNRLQSLNSDELATELVQDIQECCICSQDTANTSVPFSVFLSQIAAEEKKINRYSALAQAIQKMRLGFLFPVSRQLIEQALQRKERLIFVKKLFAKWNAKHNIRHLLQ